MLPTLPEELLEEVFLRLPTDEPACLVRASLASKLWRGLLTGPAFHGRYRELHGAAPMLGFFYCRQHRYSESLDKETEPLFLSATKFDARISSEVQGWGSLGCSALDCRHGRVVLGDKFGVPNGKLTVSDPMTGFWFDLGAPIFLVESYGAAVLCAVTDCDHRSCHGGPFRVVFVGLDSDIHGGTVASVWVSSQYMCDRSEPSFDFQLGEWVQVCSEIHFEAHLYMESLCPVLVQDALHFMLVYNDAVDDIDTAGILKYNLSSNSLSLIDVPIDTIDFSGVTILMETEDGSLGFAYVDMLNIYVWARQLGSDGVPSWAEYKVIILKEIIPAQTTENRITLIGAVPGRDIVFVNTDFGIVEINLKTLQWRKIWKREKFRSLFPYMSFYSPKEL